MGIVDSIRNSRLLGSKRSIYLNSDGTQKTVSVGGTGGFSLKGISPFKRNKKVLQNYWKYYQGEGTIFASINNIASNTVMVGYHLSSENEDAKKLIETRFNEMDIDGILFDNVIYTLVFGDSFMEKVMATRKKEDSVEKYIAPSISRLQSKLQENSNKPKHPELKRNYQNRLEQLKTMQSNGDKPKGYISYVITVDPITMEAITDKKTGEITGYQQNITGRKTPVLDTDEIIHIGFFPQSNSPYHISLIGPSKDTIDRMVGVDEASFHTAIRHSGRKYVVTIGTEEEPLPPKDVFDKIKNDLEDVTAKNEYIVPAIIKMDTIDEGGLPGIEQQATLFQKKAIVGLMVNEEGIGMSTRSSSDASSSVREIMYERFIRALQHKISTKLRTDLINPLLEEAGFEKNIVHMKFRSVTTRDEEGFAKWFGNLMRGFQFSPQKPVTINEIRDAFGLPPIEGGDDLSWGGEMKPKIQPTSDE